MTRRGWALTRATGLALTVAFLSPVSPLVLVGVPLAVFLLAYRYRSFTSLFLAAVVLAFTFSVAPAEPSPLWYGERAWGLLLGGGFVLAGLRLGEDRILARSIVALAVAFGLVAMTATLRPELVTELDWWVGGQIQRAAQAAYGWLGAGEGSWGPGLADTIQDVAELQVVLYPAFLALASVAALAVAWYVLRRLTGETEALGALRDFRFSDQLIWLLIGGLILFLLPLGDLATRLGENALVFMGGLYVLRGAAVLLCLATALVTSSWAAVAWTVAAILLYPVVVGAALLMGLSDTWLDLRGRLRRASAED